MMIDPDTPEGQRWIADHAPEFGGDVATLLRRSTTRCEICDRRFTDRLADLDPSKNAYMCRACSEADDGEEWDRAESAAEYRWEMSR